MPVPLRLFVLPFGGHLKWGARPIHFRQGRMGCPHGVGINVGVAVRDKI